MKILKIVTVLVLLIASSITQAAAPNDISNNQRAWFDAVDINGNNIYTDNPGNDSPISQWTDKSGSANNISSTGNANPLYRLNSIATERHGVDFDGVNDVLSDASDIWIGTVSESEVFILATADLIRNAFIFASLSPGNNRLSSHLPWGNSRSFFDQGICCGNPTRLQGSIPITLSEQYFWQLIGLPTQQSIVQDGAIRLNDGGASTYSNATTSSFYLGARSGGLNPHNGRIFEAIFYQTTLNNAQRRIINSYLSAKWDKAFDNTPIYADAYTGDDATNGNYDFFVGGIGQDNGLQSVGTSQGLTITNSSFLNANGKFILAGVDYLTTTPPTGLSTADIPITFEARSNRTWYIDTTGTGGLVNLGFAAASIGIPVENGRTYGLLHRTGISGPFTEVATAIMSGGVVNFSLLPADGVYSVAKEKEVMIELKKTNVVASDPINGTTNPKSIPGALIDYTITAKNSGTGNADNNTINISDTLSEKLILFTGNLDGNGNPFIFKDNFCPPSTNTLSSNLSINHSSAGAVTYQNSSGADINPSSDFDTAIRSFEINLSGAFQGRNGTDIPCFTIEYRTRIE